MTIIRSDRSGWSIEYCFVSISIHLAYESVGAGMGMGTGQGGGISDVKKPVLRFKFLSRRNGASFGLKLISQFSATDRINQRRKRQSLKEAATKRYIIRIRDFT